MGFPSGSVSFRRFAVIGKTPTAVDQRLLDKLAEHALRPSDIGAPEEVEYGWSGGHHVLDASFTFDHNVFADALHFALRVDTNKVPGELKKAYQIMEEETLASQNPSGFISKNQKKDAKETVAKKIEEELRSGRYRRSKLSPILWDLPNATLYCSAGNATFEKLSELFERTFGLELRPMTAGSLGLRILEEKSKRRDYEDLRPTRFVHGPNGEGEYPEYPWVAKGPEPKDFLGNEFLLWLWHEADARSGIITTDSAGEVTLYIDRSLDLDCAYGQTGRDTLKGDGPSRMPEAKDALRSGKLPRRAGLVVDAFKQQFTLNFNPEAMALGGVKLPEIEDAETSRIVFEERVTLIRDLCQAIDGLYETFLKVRASASWEGQVSGLRKWIMEATKKSAAA